MGARLDCLVLHRLLGSAVGGDYRNCFGRNWSFSFMTVPVLMGSVNTPIRSEGDAIRDAALADARWRWRGARCELQTMNNIGSRRLAFRCLDSMAVQRRTIMLLKMGHQKYHEMSYAYRMRQRRAAR